MFFYGTWQDLKDVTICVLERYDVMHLPGCRKTQVLDCLWSELADFHETDFRRRPDRNISRILFLFFRNRPLILFHRNIRDVSGQTPSCILFLCGVSQHKVPCELLCLQYAL